jgi:hypothetical protein
MSGFVLAIVTAFFAIMLIRDGATNASGAEAIVRVATGGALVLLALFVAALVLFPEQIRAYLDRR